MEAINFEQANPVETAEAISWNRQITKQELAKFAGRLVELKGDLDIDEIADQIEFELAA